MNKINKSIISVVLLLALIISTIVPVSAQGQPDTYSKQYNSGQRDVVCTTLDGTSADDYYVDSYEYEELIDLSSSELLLQLRGLMTSTHSYKSKYSDCHYKADRTDCENENGKVILLYTSYEATMSQWNGWNREHVWPKSLGGGDDADGTGGADLHHIRPSDSGVNSSRGNKKYGEAGANPSSKYGTDPAVGELGGYYNSTYFEPLDNVKGDVARICLYVYVRWGSEWGATNITKVFQSVDVLLEWCEHDPVDTWEMGRNEVIEDIQGNRNVFIDYPELAWLLFDREIPDDMVTPSGNAMNGVTPDPDPNPDPTPDPNPDPDPTPSVNYGTASSPVSTTDAVNACKDFADKEVSEQPFYVQGTVKSVGETGSYYKNVYITDGVTDFLIYTINMGSGIDGFEVGDTIIAHGYIKNYQGTIEMATNGGTYAYVIAVNPDEVPTPDPEPCTHSSTELRGAKNATCKETGYTGDTYCTSCGEQVSYGTTVPKTEHTWSEEVVKNPPTESENGDAECICEVCGVKKFIVIPALGVDTYWENDEQMILVILSKHAIDSLFLDYLSKN